MEGVTPPAACADCETPLEPGRGDRCGPCLESRAREAPPAAADPPGGRTSRQAPFLKLVWPGTQDDDAG